MEKKMFFGAEAKTFQRAHVLRKNMTAMEQKLWDYLKIKPLGYKFRRQHPITVYIADFYCHPLQLIIEIDGDIHAEKEVSENDTFRQLNLEAQGIKFLRFTNQEIDMNFSEVKRKIETFIELINKQ